MQKISILGCGWLGFPLAKKLVAEGFQVNGSTTSSKKLEKLENEGINAFPIELNEKGVGGKIDQFLEESEILIIAVPPGLRRNPKSDFTLKMSLLLNKVEASAVKHVLYISSTSVFDDAEDFPVYTETDVANGQKENAKQLATVEKMLIENGLFATTILRFGGLCGEDRHPVNFLSGRENISNPEAPVNLIHRNDCIALIEKIITTQYWGKTFHGVYPGHSSKKDYYSDAAKKRNLKVPHFSTENKSKGKIISSTQTQKTLDFQFHYKP